MKTFKQFLSEADVKRITEFLDDHCNKFIDMLDHEGGDAYEEACRSLFRGMHNSGESQGTFTTDGYLPKDTVEIFIKQVRQNREPLDTHVQVSNLLDDLFEKKFGWRPRSQGMFCYGKRGQGASNSFGAVNVVMPIGNFKFLWSPVVDDLTTSTGRIMSALNMNKWGDEEAEYSDEELEKLRPEFQKLVDTYKDTDFSAAIHSRGNEKSAAEIMIGCKEFACFKK